MAVAMLKPGLPIVTLKQPNNRISHVKHALQNNTTLVLAQNDSKVFICHILINEFAQRYPDEYAILLTDGCSDSCASDIIRNLELLSSIKPLRISINEPFPIHSSHHNQETKNVLVMSSDCLLFCLRKAYLKIENVSLLILDVCDTNKWRASSGTSSAHNEVLKIAKNNEGSIVRTVVLYVLELSKISNVVHLQQQVNAIESTFILPIYISTDLLVGNRYGEEIQVDCLAYDTNIQQSTILRILKEQLSFIKDTKEYNNTQKIFNKLIGVSNWCIDVFVLLGAKALQWNLAEISTVFSKLEKENSDNDDIPAKMYIQMCKSNFEYVKHCLHLYFENGTTEVADVVHKITDVLKPYAENCNTKKYQATDDGVSGQGMSEISIERGNGKALNGIPKITDKNYEIQTTMDMTKTAVRLHERLCCIIVVENNSIAQLLSKVLNYMSTHQDEFSFMKSRCLLGLAQDAENIVQAISSGAINVVVTTKTVSRDLLVGACNIFIYFGCPNSYEQFVHLKKKVKGVAPRCVFVTSVNHFFETKQMLKQFQQIEKVLGKNSRDFLPTETKAKWLKRLEKELEYYSPFGDDGPSVSLLDGVHIINQYCHSITRGDFSTVNMDFGLTRHCSLGNSDKITCTIYLPLGASVHKASKTALIGNHLNDEDYEFDIFKLKMTTALECVKLLHENGELGNNLQLVTKQYCDPEIEVNYELRDEGKGRSGTNKRRRMYEFKFPDVFMNNIPIVKNALFLYKIDMENVKTFNPQKFDTSVDSDISLGILCRSRLPKIPKFKIFTPYNEISVSIIPVVSSSPLLLGDEALRRIREFHDYVFKQLLTLPADIVLSENNGYLAVPLIFISNHTQIYFDYLRDFDNNIQLIQQQQQQRQAQKWRQEQELQPQKQEKQDQQSQKQEEHLRQDKQDKHDPMREKQDKQDQQYQKQKEQDIQPRKQEEQDLLQKKQMEQGLPQEKQEEQALPQEKQEEQGLPQEKQEEQGLPQEKQEEQDLLQEKQEEQGLPQEKQEEQGLPQEKQEEQDLLQEKQEEQGLRLEKQQEQDMQPREQREGFENHSDYKIFEKKIIRRLIPGVASSENTKYVVYEVCYDMTPDSPFPDLDVASTFKEYYSSRYGVEVQSNQPLLLVKYCSNHINFIHPRHEEQPITDANAHKKSSRDAIYLIPELCIILPITAPTWRLIGRLPTIMYRVNSLVLANELLDRIHNQTGIGYHTWPDDIPLPDLDVRHTVGEMMVDETGQHLHRLDGECEPPYCEECSQSKTADQQSLDHQQPRCHQLTGGGRDKLLLNYHTTYQPSLEHTIISGATGLTIGPSVTLISRALTAKASGQFFHSERLEFLGDSFLKFETSIELFLSETNTTDEWGLSVLRHYLVSNDMLSKQGRRLGLPGYMTISHPDVSRRFIPSGFEFDKNNTSCRETSLTSYKHQIIGDKLVANCVEALLGAYLLSCGRNAARCLLKWFGLTKRDVNDLKLLYQQFTHEYNIACGTINDGCSTYHHAASNTQCNIPSENDCSQDRILDSVIYCDACCQTRNFIGRPTHIVVPPSTILPPATVNQHSTLVATPGNHSCKDRNISISNTLLCHKDTLPCKTVKTGNRTFRDPPSTGAIHMSCDRCSQGCECDSEFDPGFISNLATDVIDSHLGYRFKNRHFLGRVFLHGSYPRWLTTIPENYQTFEFLGDAILDYLVTVHLCCNYPHLDHGDLTDFRSALVNNFILSYLAVQTGLHRFMKSMLPWLLDVVAQFVEFLDNQETKRVAPWKISVDAFVVDNLREGETSVEVPKVLGDLFESLIGAVYLDCGMNLAKVWDVFYPIFKPFIDYYKDDIPKSPVRTLHESFPDKVTFSLARVTLTKSYTCSVNVVGYGRFEATGRTTKIAKSSVARKALRHIRNEATKKTP